MTQSPDGTMGMGTDQQCDHRADAHVESVNEAQYGVGSYNTREVAEELRYIEQNILPSPRGMGRRREF